jgi:thiol-disulfide isomerase/thioredoxin
VGITVAGVATLMQVNLSMDDLSIVSTETKRRVSMKTGLRTLLAAFSLLVAATAFAAETKPFDQATFDALQAANKPVLVDVYADWCPTCKQQEPLISALIGSPEFKDYTVLKVNFDTQKDVRKTLRVNYQSTLIVYRGKQEVARSTGDTNKDSIAASLRKGLS